LVLLAFVFSIPFAAKYYAETNYPIKVGSVVFNINSLTFHNVQVSKQNITGTLDNVTVDYEKIVIDGGNINYSFVKGDGTKNKSLKNIIASNINARITYKDIVADVFNLSYIKGSVSADRIVFDKKIKDINTTTTLYGFYTNQKTATIKHGKINTTIGSIYLERMWTDKETLTVSYVDVNSLAKLYGSVFSIKDSVLSTNIESIKVEHKYLYSEPITLSNINIPSIYINDLYREVEGSVNGVWFTIDPIAQRIRANEHCQNWVDSLPKELITKEIEQIKFNGSFGFDVSLTPDVNVKISENCTLKNKPAFLSALNKTFSYTAYHPNKESFKRTSGPGSAEWVGINDISSNVLTALEVAEDPSFLKHQGIVPKSLENCLRYRINNGRKCGGSTITMQLAKNLWLNRGQTAGRKIQEIILTKALESMSKEQILELYVNVVEFGPDLYGIGPAADKLLETYPADLNLDESLFLAFRLSSPNKAGTFEQTKGFRKKFLTNLAMAGKISEQDLEMILKYDQDN
jgi:hypothetical protein